MPLTFQEMSFFGDINLLFIRGTAQVLVRLIRNIAEGVRLDFV